VRVDVLAGSARELPEKSGLASLEARLIPSGGGSRGEREVAAAFDAIGATLDASADRERTVVRSRMRSADLATLLPLLEEMVAATSFPKGSFERERAGAVALARSREKSASAVAEISLRGMLY